MTFWLICRFEIRKFEWATRKLHNLIDFQLAIKSSILLLNKELHNQPRRRIHLALCLFIVSKDSTIEFDDDCALAISIANILI